MFLYRKKKTTYKKNSFEETEQMEDTTYEPQVSYHKVLSSKKLWKKKGNKTENRHPETVVMTVDIWKPSTVYFTRD